MSLHRSTSLDRTHAQILGPQSQLWAYIRRKLLRTQDRRCVLACVVRCVLRALNVASVRSMLARACERGRLTYARSKRLRAKPAPGREESSSRPYWTERALINLPLVRALKHRARGANFKRTLPRTQARICELACVVGCVSCALEAGCARPLFGRELEPGGSTFGRSK